MDFIKQARQILRRAKPPRKNHVSEADLVKALQSQQYLGLAHVPAEDYVELLVETAREFSYPIRVSHQLTWPEFVIARASIKGLNPSRDGLGQDTLIILRILHSVGGVIRQPGLTRFLTWDGWQELK